MMNSTVPEIRVRQFTDYPIHPNRDFVLYRMRVFRRLTWNFALQRAMEWARELDRPLVVYEELRLGVPWESVRRHRFILDGIQDHMLACKERPVLYYPYLETEAGSVDGLLQALCQRACILIEEESPVLHTNRSLVKTDRSLLLRIETVDSNGLLPLRASDRDYPTAYSFRRFLQKELPAHLLQAPLADPLQDSGLAKAGPPIADILERWPALRLDRPGEWDARLSSLPINHQVTATVREGGSRAALRQLQTFLDERLDRYGDDRNEPEKQGTSELSSYLRHGHIATHQVFHALAERQDWSLQRLALKATGKRSGWWGMPACGEAFLDELVTWRELGYNMAFHRPDYRDYDSLPEWSRISLDQHRDDPRPVLYSFEQFEQAQTHDPLWNAAQNQLRQEGLIHNYLRMLWGKKILEWTKSAREAAEVMIELNNRYALDGCDPNSYSGIYWCLGRYDRAWGPERPIFGKIRYMSSENTARKYPVRNYIKRYTGT
jgi:deoxyribodipyrimidine photo-lyase